MTTVQSKTTIDAVRPAEQARAIDALMLAFVDDPIVRWFLPDPRQYVTTFPQFVHLFAGRAFEAGTAYRADHFAGVALWLPPGLGFDEEEFGGLLERNVREEDKEDLFSMLELATALHPSYPHWYLPLIGVDPPLQGRGYGSALLSRVLPVCDEQRLPAYLESSNERNIPLYERHGFRIVEKLQFGNSPPLWPMLREPR